MLDCQRVNPWDLSKGRIIHISILKQYKSEWLGLMVWVPMIDMKGAASLRSFWISTENGNPSGAKPQKQPPTRRKRFDASTVWLWSIESIISYDLAAPSKKRKLAGQCGAEENGHNRHREFSECRDDPRSRESSKDLQLCFLNFEILFFFSRVFPTFSASWEALFLLIKSVRPDLGGGLQSLPPRHGMHSGGVGRWGSLGVNGGDGPFGSGEEWENGEFPIQICENPLEIRWISSNLYTTFLQFWPRTWKR